MAAYLAASCYCTAKVQGVLKSHLAVETCFLKRQMVKRTNEDIKGGQSYAQKLKCNFKIFRYRTVNFCVNSIKQLTSLPVIFNLRSMAVRHRH